MTNAHNVKVKINILDYKNHRKLYCYL